MRKTEEPYLSAYFHAKGRALGLPIAGNFELTARCNFSCPMCYVRQSAEQVRGRELTAEQWLALARDAREQGMIFALLTGGEPLVRTDFFEIYRGMKAMGLMISVNTNGSLLQGEALERILEDPPTRINISLYGGCNETYEKMCGNAAYDRVKENIRALRRAGVEVSLNVSITPQNCGDLEKIYADALELGVSTRASSYMYPPVRRNAQADARLSAAEAARWSVKWDELRFSEEEFARRAEQIARHIGDCREGCPVEPGEGIACRAGSTSFWITWEGKMLPCGMMTAPAVDPLEQGFSVAWEELRAQVSRLRRPGECAACQYKEVCGVCAAVCVTETGRFDGVPRYICEKTREQVRLTGEIYRKRLEK